MSTENLKENQDLQNQKQVSQRSRIPNVTIINIVLLIGLLVLYALYFFPQRAGQQMTDGTNADAVEAIAEDAFRVAYVNSDSLMSNYKLAITMREQFENEQRRLENDLQQRQRDFQEEVESFQRRIQSGLVSQEEGMQKEQELSLTQQELIQMNDTYANRLRNKEIEMNSELYDSITSFLRRYNEEKDYDYIFGFVQGGGNILFARDQHDITNEVLSGLNQEYDEKN
ncbi:MAG: OmpH family outer membrane protein [Bacteroidota bacterium]